MLLNIIRSRYADSLVFLLVDSVVSQYGWTASAGLNGFYQNESVGDLAPSLNTYSLGTEINGSYRENPTITYTPLGGQAYASYLLSNVGYEKFFVAAHGGWSVDVVMRVGIQRFGGVENMSFGDIRVKDQIPVDLERLESFARTIELLFVLNDREIIEVQQVQKDAETDEENSKKVYHYLVISEQVPAELRPILAEFRQFIGIPKGNRFRITRKTTNVSEDQISIVTRSVMAMMEFMGRGIIVPVEHIEKGWVRDYGMFDSEMTQALFPFIMRSSRNRPQNAFAAVRYQGYWFYIAQDDITSKRTLNILQVLFQLKGPKTKGTGPILTIPTS